MSFPEVVDPDLYAKRGFPLAEWARLRRDEPVAFFELENAKPFWAVTRHADIVSISRQPRRFLNAPRFVVNPEVRPGARTDTAERHLLNMDPPEHAAYRRLVSSHFTPRALRALEPAVERVAGEVLDAVSGDRREGDFVKDVAAVLPLAVIAEALGVPAEDRKLLFDWTNAVAGSADPEYQQGAEAGETLDRAQRSMFEYFGRLAEERRARPRDDLVSVLVKARLDGAPVPDFELLSYFFLLVVAGNETTRNATSRGLLTLIEHPDAWGALCRDPGRVERAVEEILRFTSPVIQFCRTAVEDVELHGQRVRAGDSLVLFYPSANRDERVFDEPDRFDVDRHPNPHLAFGIGEHFCLGAHLARLELRSIFRALARRLVEVELAGPVHRLRSSVIGGIKHMPLRYRLLPS